MAHTPSLRRRRLAQMLRTLRENAGLEQGPAAERAGFSRVKLNRIEAATVKVSGDDTYTLAKTYGADAATTDRLVALARQSSKRGWWHVHSDEVLGGVAGLVELEDDAKLTCQFAVTLVPGLFQTEQYAAAVIAHGYVEKEPEQVAKRVALRMERQDRMLNGGDHELSVIIDESVLRRPVGGHEVMAEQCEHIAAMAKRPGITVRVLPEEAARHSVFVLPFTLITLRDGAEYAYVETLTGGAHIDESTELELYRLAWRRLQATALDVEQSGKLLTRFTAEHSTITE